MDNTINFKESEDALEILKMTKDDAHIFKLPPMTSSEGHNVDDFQELIFKGKLKMTLKGEFMIIYLINPDNTVFLFSIVSENIDLSVTKAKGSSRYFTIKAINDKGIPSYVGLGMYTI